MFENIGIFQIGNTNIRRYHHEGSSDPKETKPLSDLLEEREEFLPHYIDPETHESTHFSFNSDFDFLKNFGSGTFLYFYFIKTLAVTFTVMTLIVAVKCSIFNRFDQLDQQNEEFPFYLKFSLANIIGFAGEASEISLPTGKVFFIVDCLPSVVLTVYVLWFGFKMQNLEKEIDQKWYNMKDFSFVMENVPVDLKEDEVRRMFEEYGQVELVYLFRKYVETIKLVEELARLKQKSEVMVKNKHKNDRIGKIVRNQMRHTSTRMIELETILNQKRKNNDVFCVFVTMSKITAKNKIFKVNQNLIDFLDLQKRKMLWLSALQKAQVRAQRP
jgi:hypothetical protein